MMPAPRLCHCGQPARGLVPDDGVPPEAKYSAMTHHDCRQCSPDHCLLRQAVANRAAGVSEQPAEPDAQADAVAQPALF